MRAGRRVGPFLGIWLTAALCHASQSRADTCEVVAVGVDTSLASSTGTFGLICGEAFGETFVAADTLIRSVAVWRAAAQTPYGGYLKLWITETDSSGVPQVDRKLLDGPAITVPFGDGVHPIKMEWIFDPPFALPRRGTYFFTVQDWCGGHWGLLRTDSKVYGGGSAWKSGRTCFDEGGCYLWRTPNPSFLGVDLVFTIEFCQMPTPVSPVSWGRLKVIYR